MATDAKKPLTTLQGHETSLEPLDDDHLAAIRTHLLHLIRTDPEVKAMLAMVRADPASPQALSLEPDAALARWITDLIEQVMYRTLRQDAYRRPK